MVRKAPPDDTFRGRLTVLLRYLQWYCWEVDRGGQGLDHVDRLQCWQGGFLWYISPFVSFNMGLGHNGEEDLCISEIRLECEPPATE